MRHFKDVIERVKNDRFLKIVVGEGEGTQVFYIQETLLIGVSDVLAAMTRHENFGEEEKGTYKFPDDPVRAWEVFIYWLVKGGLPEDVEEVGDDDKGQSLWVQCWTLGDKYNTTSFQDEAMLELLLIFERTNMTPECAGLATNSTPPGSKLRLLVCNEIIYSVYHRKKSDMGLFDEALTAVGFGTEALAALDKYHEKGRVVKVDYVGHEHDGGWRDEWRQYMVGVDDACQHWVSCRVGDMAWEAGSRKG